MTDFWRNRNIVVTGGAGLLGRHVVAGLQERGVQAEKIFVPRSREYDLRTAKDAARALEGADIVLHLAGVVGGIGMNRKFPAKLYYDNAAMALHVIEAARAAPVQKFVAIGSACDYPVSAPIPFREEDFWSGYPEATNASYSLAKRGMLAQLQAYRAQFGFPGVHIILATLYGPGDHFDPDNSHVVSALIRRFSDAAREGLPSVTLWGSGAPMREFLFVADAAEAVLLAAERYDRSEPLNIGSGQEASIRALAGMIAGLTGYTGEIRWDTEKPDGQARRSIDSSRAREIIGFSALTSLEEGLLRTIQWYEANKKSAAPV